MVVVRVSCRFVSWLDSLFVFAVVFVVVCLFVYELKRTLRHFRQERVTSFHETRFTIQS